MEKGSFLDDIDLLFFSFFLEKMEIRRDCNVPDCDEKHYFIFNNNVANISPHEFFKIIDHWEKKVKRQCGENCKYKNFCTKHNQLNLFLQIKYKIMNEDPHKILDMTEIKKNYMNNWNFELRTFYFEKIELLGLSTKILEEKLKLLEKETETILL